MAVPERKSNGFSSAFFLICLLVSGICFFYGITGTQQHRQATKPIQEVELGDRVAGINPHLSDEERNVADPDPARWREVTLRMTEPDGAVFKLKLLCPPEWTELHSAEPGDAVALNLEELGAVGTAKVLSVGPCPPIRPGPGSVVTAIYIHSSAHALDLHLDSGETLGVTPAHPMWSDDRQDFVPASTLQPGEHLLALDGRRVAITDITPRAGPEPVYNLQVHGERVYQVGSDGLLVHNKALRKGPHAQLRSRQGRPVPQVYNDVQRANPRDVFVQPDGRFVVRGPKQREHIIEPDGVVVTSVRRPKAAHENKVRSGVRRLATAEEFEHLKNFQG